MYKHFTHLIETPDGKRNTTFTPTNYGIDLYYSIKIDGVDQFRMTRDEEGQWKISAQILPLWVHEKDLELNDLIEEVASRPE